MAQIQMVDLKTEYQHYKNQLDPLIEDVLTSGYFIGGPNVKKFKEELSAYLNHSFITPCGNGTDALQIALMALDLQPGDEVILPAFTYVAPAECCALLKLKPVFVDIDPENYNIDCSKIEEVITEKTKAIIPVHLFGQTVDMTRINEIAQKHNLFVIEDTAQAFGAKLNGVFAGLHGDIGCTSFFPSKNLGCYGDGGAIFTKNEAFGAKCTQIASHGQSGKKFYHDAVGVNSRLDAIQSVVLSVKLKDLDKAIEKRKTIGNRYNQELASINELITPVTTNGMDHTYHQYVLQVKNGKRDAFREYMKENGVATGIYYPHTIPSLPPYFSDRAFPIADQMVAQSVGIPVHPFLTEEQQIQIITTIKAFFNA